MKVIRPLLTGVLLIASVLACNLPGAATQPALSVNDQAATAIAGTLTAQARNASKITITATFSPAPQATSTVVITSTIGPTATITPTYSVPMLTLREQTNCRVGPGLSYDILFAYVKGVEREIIGHYAQENYWLVKAPESVTGECWIWGEYAEISGSYWVVPELTPPPTATLSLPKAPAVKWEYFCNYAVGQMDISFTWTDHASNEDGYRVVRDGETIAELPANSTAYADSFAFTAGEKIVYYIEVYNVTGVTSSAAVSITC